MNTDENKMKEDGSELLGVLFSDVANEMPAPEVTEVIIGCSFTVSNTLGRGFLEKVYENALAHGLRKASFLLNRRNE